MPLPERVRQLRNEHGKMTPSADIVVRIAQALDVSCDYLLVDDAPRRSFRSPDRLLGERLAVLDELPEDGLASLLNHLDALVARNRLKTIAGDLA